MRFAAIPVMLVVATVTACAPRAQQARGATMGTFVPDDAIASVEVCKTSEQELLQRFGAPAGQGSDGVYKTLQWSGAAVVVDNQQGMTAMQIIYVWVSDGLVAGMVVNPVGMPTAPASPCPGAGAA